MIQKGFSVAKNGSSSLLDTVNTPADLKDLSAKQLKQPDDVRRETIEAVNYGRPSWRELGCC